VDIRWNAVDGAENYRVYYYGSRGWTKMVDTASTSYLDKDVESGKNYTYTVRCINAAGNGIGHNLELIVDGQMSMTYNLNDYFQYEFGDYKNGTVGFSIPALTEGQHTLLFRAWDILDNSSTAELSFVVDPRQEPALLSVICTNNPTNGITRFVISHDRTGSEIGVVLEIFDMAGRKLWEKSETGVPADNTYIVDWDLTVGSGSRLHTGVYLYRLLVSSNGSTQATNAQKLIVIGNK